MFARVNIFQGSPEGLDRSTKLAQEQVLPALREVDGSAGILILGDRRTGRSLAITLWGSQDALNASEEAAQTLRTDSAAEADEEIVGVERYEVLHEERWGR